MTYAIPYLNGNVAPHFARAPEIAIVDDSLRLLDRIAVPVNPSQCGSKKFWQQTLKQHQVTAVVVNTIGSKMLNSLFNQGIEVFSAPRKQSVADINAQMLTPVTELSYAKAPRKAHGGCCGGSEHSHASGHKLTQVIPASFRGFKAIK
ncbi:NifB/NifX family molybdenum-iron cluster-binding protein [Vibrio intestinalis]|uniref:NifB/NifX family molybdenum-iron cluster-binding protein n=1 Tax=Vibrio intestinalis TaxID=2933291 RepID=UPI0021A26108|nr:NifB/NifX family molybdenum-iron cluster-binding protein [Vibrio intestinalis]